MKRICEKDLIGGTRNVFVVVFVPNEENVRKD